MIWILWALCGLVAAGWLLHDEWEIHQAITVTDLIISVFVFIFGPVVLLIGVLATLWFWIERNGSKIDIKRRKYDI